MANLVITTLGAGSWTVPANVYFVDIECWGAGAGAAGTDNTNSYAAGGGGAGAYVKHRLYVNPGDIINYFVASAGIGGTNADGTDGQDTWFVDNLTILAKGGKKGVKSKVFGFVPNGGLGAKVSECIGQFRKRGGDAGSSSGNITGGGGGGGGATDGIINATNGTDGGVSAGGSGGLNGGGNGGNKANNGTNATSVAAGGGGGGINNPSSIGGNGFQGKIVLTWNTDVISTFKNISSIQGVQSIQF